MQPRERETFELRIRELCAGGEVSRAVETALEGYGPEVQRLLGAILRDDERAREAFGDFGESLLRDLPGFRWESSFRTWAYRVARNIAYRLASSSGRQQPVSRRFFEQEAQAERTRTCPWLRSSVKERFRALRSQLAPQEQRLLTLRVDQRMAWLDVARELVGPGERPSAEVLHRKAAVLRQQFQHLKRRLRELAQEDRLLSTA